MVLMSAKQFLKLEKQISKLNNEKYIEVKGKVSREYLVRNGYFNLVNGYKDYFCKANNGCRKYFSNIKIDDLKDVMQFDRNLRKIIFKYVTQIEEEIGTIFGYVFERDLSSKNLNWGDMSLYENDKVKTGREILSRLYGDISRRNNEYLMHYEGKHSYLPSWIMIKALNFGTLIKLISNTNNLYKKQLCDLYSIKYDEKYNDFRKLTALLSLINALRNKIAHSERIIDFKGNIKNKRTITKYHDLMGYNNIARENLLDVIIYMKMFIPGKEYKHLINEVINEFDTLKKRIHNNAFIKICKSVGLDTSRNYKISLAELKNNSHNINYSLLI
jgi:abortive infection bacteriophage resistance protein